MPDMEYDVGDFLRFLTIVGQWLVPVWWDVMTSLIMPAVAIFASGALALYLQRRDHARSDAQRAEEREQREAAELRAKKALLVQSATRQHDYMMEVAVNNREHYGELMAAWTRLVSDWGELPDKHERMIGMWLFSRHKDLIGIAQAGGVDPGERAIDLAVEMVDVSGKLVDWLMGRRKTLWFVREVMNDSIYSSQFDESWNDVRRIADEAAERGAF